MLICPGVQQIFCSCSMSSYFSGDLQGFEMVLTFVGLVVLFRVMGRFGMISLGEGSKSCFLKL